MADNKAKKKKNSYLSNGDNIAVNRRARFDYEIEETFEAGLVLTGSEVKSLRLGNVSINESYATEEDGDIVLINANIAEYQQAPRHLQHNPTRVRKLLLHQKQINKLMGSVQREGMSIVPMKMFFNNRGLAKIIIGLGKGKKQADKRDTIKKRDWSRQKQRLLREKG